MSELAKRDNAHTNGLIRWYLPKGTDFGIIIDKEVAHIESLINNRPKKCLDSNYLNKKTPIEVASSFVALYG
jgi:IS30 family transposase